MILTNYKKLFAPAISFMGRRSYLQKFALMGIFFIVPLTATSSLLILKEYQYIAVHQQKVAGIRYLNSLSILLRNVQQHRGMSAVIIAGDEDFRQKRTEVAEHVAQTLEVLPSYGITAEKNPELEAQLSALVSGWGNLLKELETATAAEESFILHTAYIQSIVSLMRDVGDATGLFLGEEATDHYLAEMAISTLPEMSENIGQSRAYGVSIPREREFTEEEKHQFAVFLATVKEHIGKLEHEASAITRREHSSDTSLSNMVNISKNTLGTLMSTYEKEFIDKEKREISNEMYWRITTSATDTILNTYSTLLRIYATNSDAHIRALERERDVIIALSIFSLFLAVYFFAGFYLSFKNAIDSLKRTTKKILAGTQDERLVASTSDEIGELTSLFNEIMDAFMATNKRLSQSNNELKEYATKQKETEEKLKERAFEVDKFNRLMIGRELKMVDLKEEILELREQLANRER